MMNETNLDTLLIEGIRTGDAHAWQQFIERFEGRLLAYVGTRLVDRSHAEDIVQETFIGFLNSIPNYDASRPLESYLFSIAAYKLTDHLRREGRRHTTQWVAREGSSDAAQNVPSKGRAASSLARSVERRDLEEEALAVAIADQISKWKSKSDYQKLQCIELLFVAGASNKDVSLALNLSEQQVANYKSDFVTRTRNLIARHALQENFPELLEG